MSAASGHDLSGQSAIVTGGTRGIGAAISRALLAAGARVTALYRADEAAASAFFAGNAEAKRLAVERLDVSDHEAVQRFFAAREGPLQILVNNAGVRQDGLTGMLAKEAWDRVLTVNLDGAFHMCKFAVRAMISARYGRIVNITSPSGHLGFSGQSNYAAAKGGLTALTRSLAREVATRGITVNCVAPGFVLTDLIKDLPARQLDAMKAVVPLGRFGEPAEIAAAVLFLASPAASYISGATLAVTGGIPL